MVAVEDYDIAYASPPHPPRQYKTFFVRAEEFDAAAEPSMAAIVNRAAPHPADWLTMTNTMASKVKDSKEIITLQRCPGGYPKSNYTFMRASTLTDGCFVYKNYVPRGRVTGLCAIIAQTQTKHMRVVMDYDGDHVISFYEAPRYDVSKAVTVKLTDACTIDDAIKQAKLDPRYSYKFYNEGVKRGKALTQQNMRLDITRLSSKV